MQLEDLGFCKKGEGGKFVADGNLISGTGKLPFNTDGGGLCNNHPANRGGMTKIIEAVRQLRGEAHPEGAGAELRPRARARHRRRARAPARQRHTDHGKGVKRWPHHTRNARSRDPAMNPGDEPYFDAAAEGKLHAEEVQRLQRSSTTTRARCARSASATRSSGCRRKARATIYTYSVTRRGGPMPYCIAYVTLDEGVTMMTNIVDCDLDTIKIGQKVKVVFKKTESGSMVPMFTSA